MLMIAPTNCDLNGQGDQTVGQNKRTDADLVWSDSNRGRGARKNLPRGTRGDVQMDPPSVRRLILGPGFAVDWLG